MRERGLEETVDAAVAGFDEWIFELVTRQAHDAYFYGQEPAEASDAGERWEQDGPERDDEHDAFIIPRWRGGARGSVTGRVPDRGRCIRVVFHAPHLRRPPRRRGCPWRPGGS